MDNNTVEYLEGGLASLDIGNGAYGQSFQLIKEDLAHKGFQNMKEIERGSSGIVVSVIDASNESYAIKIISLEKDPQKQRQYTRELNIMKNKLLSRDYIVGYFAHWPKCIDNADYLSIQMELCWRSLDTIIQEQRDVIKTRDPPRFYQHVFPQILKGLSKIHSIGWVHRDIHPGNILIVRPFEIIRDIHVKIADFGNAKEIGSIMEASGKETVSAEPTFTMPYDAPEANSDDRRYNYKIDLFLAGLVLCRISGFNRDAPSKNFIHDDDDILADLRCRLLTKRQPIRRPNAEEALEFAWKEREFRVEPRTPNIIIHTSSLPCVTRDNTIHSLKAVIHEVLINSDAHIPLESQVLQRKKITNGQEELTDITSDEHVKRMFEDKEDVFIVVSLKTSELNSSDLSNPEV